MRSFTIAALTLATFVSAPAHAWSQQSHMTTGAIAYDDLAATSPRILAKAEDILKAHPDHEKLAAHAAGLTGAERTRVMFEWLARWSDDVRETPMDKPDWHYELRVVYGWTWLWPFRNGNASVGFDESFRTLSDPTAPAKERAVALGWLMHIVGDMQQPLHAGHQMTATFYATDEAGGLAFVHRAPDDTPIELHEYWDQALDVASEVAGDGAGDETATSKAWAKPLQKLWPRAKIKELTYAGTPQEQFGQWMDESMYLAKLFYKGTAIKATADGASAPLVTPHELRVTQELSKRRVATGGYRIADTIRMALGHRPTTMTRSVYESVS